MYIREDLLNKIKEIFDVKEFTYVRTGKHCYNDDDLFIFDCGNETIAIEVGTTNFFLYTKPKKTLITPDIFTGLHKEISYLSKTTKLV